jgi:hypothetical protein
MVDITFKEPSEFVSLQTVVDIRFENEEIVGLTVQDATYFAVDDEIREVLSRKKPVFFA